jgi:acetylornithine deacetylase/succinyl-diaminopimelate desuccinylase-like protein
MSPARALEYAEAHGQRFLAELKEFIRFPTISAHPQRAGAIRQCAAWLANHLRRIGMNNVNLIPTHGHPVVYADYCRRDGGRSNEGLMHLARTAARCRTVLIYGHYDVQPVDPLREWHSPPFEPMVRGEDLYGRGACDDKGQMFAHVKALESYLKSHSGLPVNVKCLFEGEEEVGSPNLIPFVRRNQRALAADVAVASDTHMLGPDQPAISYAERGSLNLELEIRGPKQDLHSGNFGGAVHNPLQALCEIIGKLHGSGGRIAIPHFYDRVRRWSESERLRMARIGPSDEDILRQAGVAEGWGEDAYTLYERTTVRPSLSVTGIVGGYQGPGVKRIIPGRALGKINFRLVPDQDPREIDLLFREYIARVTPPSVRATIRTHSRAKPVVMDPSHQAMRAAALAYRHAFGFSPVFLRSGGTIPVVSTFREVLGMPTVLMGFALPDDRIHAPNEKFHLPNFYRGIDTSLWFLAAMGARRDQEFKADAEDEEWCMAYDH